MTASAIPKSRKAYHLLRRVIRFGVNPVIVTALAAMIIMMIFRLILVCRYNDVLPENSLQPIILQGIRVDFASVCALFAPPLLLLAFINILPIRRVPKTVFRIISVYAALSFTFICFNEFATHPFINEYGVRPNHLYVQYLKYPAEVFKTLWFGHRTVFLLILASVPLVIFLSYRLSLRLFAGYNKGSSLYGITALLLSVCIVPLGVRSSLGHRPLNPAMVAFSENALANSLPVNSGYSIIYAVLHLNDTDIGEDVIYDLAEDEDVLNEIQRFSALTPPKYYDPKCPVNQLIQPFTGIYTGHSTDTFHRDSSRITAEPEHKKYNVVVILEESLGANFVESLGGYPVTPYIEKLKERGWWFTNLYAAGHRSVRGIEAVTAGMPPSPLNSIVKLPRGSTHYATLMSIFSKAGYKTSFVYGGESHFDNMRQYFLENGTDTVIEQKDYPNPSFLASWGVSDEDLFDKADEIIKEHHAKGENFFMTVFSSSFHDPFEIPEGKVSLDGLETDEPERLLAAKYADYALGRFMFAALEKPYAKDTIFVIIADHESRVRGAGVFPLHDFTIPALIIAPNVRAHTDHRVVSQIDIPVTVLSLAGIQGEVPNVGQVLTRNDVKQRAIMQFNNIFALYENRRLLQIAPYSKPYTFVVGEDGETLLKETDTYKSMLNRAVNLSNLGPLIYRKELMREECIKLESR